MVFQKLHHHRQCIHIHSLSQASPLSTAWCLLLIRVNPANRLYPHPQVSTKVDINVLINIIVTAL